MSYVCIQTRAQIGLDSPSVSVEVHLANGLPYFHIVGLPEMAVRESRERVRAAIINSHFQFPSKRITVNLAPAELPKQGGRFDLAIAIGLLLASEQIRSQQIQEYEFLGELSLSGKLLRSHAVLPSAHQCASQNSQGRTIIHEWKWGNQDLDITELLEAGETYYIVTDSWDRQNTDYTLSINFNGGYDVDESTPTPEDPENPENPEDPTTPDPSTPPGYAGINIANAVNYFQDNYEDYAVV